MPIRLVIGCRSYLLSEGLKKLLEDEPEINIVGIFDESKDSEEIVKLNPDIVLTDSHVFCGLPDNFATDSQIKIILIADRTWYSTTDSQVANLISRGLVGIFPLGADSRLLKKAIKAIYSGELWIDRKTLKNILSKKGLPEKSSNLTRKEREIASFISQGYRNKEIAQKLNISEQTVKSHCNRIYKKVGVSDRLQLAIYVYKMRPDFS